MAKIKVEHQFTEIAYNLTYMEDGVKYMKRAKYCPLTHLGSTAACHEIQEEIVKL